VQRTFEPDQRILPADQPADGLYILRTGKCLETLRAETSLASAVVSVHHSRSCFGQVSLLDGQQQGTDVFAAERA
jgi:CRP-like cAMP-binding protein